MKLRKYVYIFLVVITITLSGCSTKMGYIDKNKKISEEEVKQYTLKQLKELYNIDAEIIEVSKEQIHKCSGYIDGCCYGKKVVPNGYSYSIKLKVNDIEFYATYKDAYTNTKEHKYYDVEFKDTYMSRYNDKVLNNEAISKFNNILLNNNIKGYVYNDSKLDSVHYFAILININDLSKLDKLYNEATSYLYNYCQNKDINAKISFILSNDEILNNVKNSDNAAFNLYSLNSLYKFENLYSDKNNILTINTNNYNNYVSNSNKQYTKYLVKVEYIINKNGYKVNNDIYGFENK